MKLHDDECDKTTYGPEGVCTCDDRRDNPDEEATRIQEDYQGPELDW